MNPYIFLLGGQDLEMLTIRKLLLDHGYEEGRNMIDLTLNWGAALSAYSDWLQPSEKKYIGIELKTDLEIPDGVDYQLIDHHNEQAHLPASIEQVASLLGIELTREQQLIAANDKGYIGAMIAAGATKKEWKNIRRQDREAQGVSDEDEQLAKKSLKKHARTNALGWTLVKSLTPRFSAVRDRIPHDHPCIIYDQAELVYYGPGISRIARSFQQTLGPDPSREALVWGGGETGYFMLLRQKLLPMQPASTLIQKIEQAMTKYSHHTFLFPFKWYPTRAGFSLTAFVEKLMSQETVLGKLSPNEFGTAHATTYSEFTYFYDFVAEALYAPGKDLRAYLQGQEPASKADAPPAMFFHLQHNLAQREHASYYAFELAKEKKTYRLRIDSILLNLYEAGVGVLSFHLENGSYPDPQDILNINQFGRRLFPQFLDKEADPLQKVKNTLLPDWIAIQQKSGDDEKGQPILLDVDGSRDDFSRYRNLQQVGKSPFLLPRLFNAIFPAGSIEGLNDAGAGDIRIYPVMDDRMFVVSWYQPNEKVPKALFSRNIDFSRPDTYDEKARDFWYQYIYLDHDGPTSVNDHFTAELLAKASYTRWSGYGSLFGVTRYSLMALTGFSPIKTHMEGIYYKMAELCLVQRALMLRFSDEATHFSRRKLGQISNQEWIGLEELHQNYLRFINKIYFREITAQDQGIELYDKLKEALRLPQQVKDLESEIETLYQYGQLVQEDRRNKQLDTLTWVGGLFLLPAILLAFLGITELSSEKVNLSPTLEWGLLIASGLMTLGGLGIFALRSLPSGFPTLFKKK